MAWAGLDQTSLLYTQKYHVSKLYFNRVLLLTGLNYNRYISGVDKFRLLFSRPEQTNMSDYLNFNFSPTNPYLFQMSYLFHFRHNFTIFIFISVCSFISTSTLFYFVRKIKLHLNEFYNLNFHFNLLIYSVLKNTMEWFINYFLVYHEEFYFLYMY